MLRRPIPVAVLVGVACGLLAVALRLVGTPRGDDLEAFFRWQLVRGALAQTEDLLITVGLFALARRMSGTPGAALRVAAWASLAVCAWFAASPLLELALERRPWAGSFYRWSHCVVTLVGLGASGAIVVAARGLQRARLASALILGALLARGVFPPIVDALHAAFRAHPDLGAAYWALTGVLWSVGLLWLVAVIELADPAPEPRRAATGFRVAAAALRFRLVIAVVLAVTGVGILRTQALLDIVLIGGPTLAIAATAIAAVGFLIAAHAAVGGLPALRIALGAAATLWFAAVQLVQVSWTYQAMHAEYSYFAEHTNLLMEWSIAGPVISIVGLGLVGSAISAFAAARAHDGLREAAMVRTLLTVVLFGSGTAIQTQLWKASTPDGRLLLAVVAAIAVIGAIVAMIGLLRQTAAVLEDGPDVPVARVVSSG